MRLFLSRHRALGWSLLVNVLIVLTELVTRPLHESGKAQDLLGYVNGAAHVLNLPGFTFADLTSLRPRQAWTWRGLVGQTIVNIVFYWALFGFWRRLVDRLCCPPAAPAPQDQKHPREQAPPVPPLSRRRLIVGAGRIVGGTAAACGAWAFFAEPRWFEINRLTVSIRGLPRSLNRLRIAHVTDVHHGAWLSLSCVRQVVQAANALSPDLVLLTGDYTYRGLEYVEPVAFELAKLRPHIGTLAVMGNHDWWINGKLTQRAMEKNGIPLIDNRRLFITPNRKLVADAEEGLCIAGVGDLWEDKCRFDHALGGLHGGMPRLLLSHNPDAAEEPAFLRSGLRVDLMLAGHTHGGQVRLPGLGTPVTNSSFGSKYAQGLVQGPVCPVFVSRGLGMTALPIRFGAPPEIVLIELQSI